MSAKDSGGPGPNQVSRDWFKEHRGKKISVFFDRTATPFTGILVRYDLYNVLLDVDERHVLLKQAPGMRFEETLDYPIK